MAGIGTVMFGKAVLVVVGGAIADWYRAYRQRRRREAVIFLQPDKRGVYVPADDGFTIFERWGRRCAWTLYALCIALGFLMFSVTAKAGLAG